jgi:ligand-binding SRPBCC domain-containing protein
VTRVFRLEREQVVPRPLDETFAFFSDAQNLQRITPPWLHFEVLTPEIAMRTGAVIDYRLRLRGVPIRWSARIEDWQPGRAFVDRQIRGPYRLWHHRHVFEPAGDQTLMRDVVHYALPLGPLGAAARALFVRRDVERIFDYRVGEIARLLG